MDATVVLGVQVDLEMTVTVVVTEIPDAPDALDPRYAPHPRFSPDFFAYRFKWSRRSTRSRVCLFVCPVNNF